MRDRLFQYCRFTAVRAWRIDSAGVVAVCMLVIMAFGCTGAALSAYTAEQRTRAAHAGLGHGAAVATTDRSNVSAQRTELRPFVSNELLDALNGASTALALPVNEIVFRFDDNPLRPYLRYTATVKVFGGYPVVRKFVAAVRQPLPQTSLDAISCSRTDILSAHVSCELTLSAFYRRAPDA